LTPLHYAASGGHSEIAKMLLACGANVNAECHCFKWTPLHCAAEHGHLEAVKMLLDAGADRSAIDSEGFTPSGLAAKNTHLDIVQELSSTLAASVRFIKQYRVMFCFGSFVATAFTVGTLWLAISRRRQLQKMAELDYQA
jgi:ankyrin repeat protein